MITYSGEQKEYFEKLLKPEDLEKLPLYYTFCELLENCKEKFSAPYVNVIVLLRLL